MTTTNNPSNVLHKKTPDNMKHLLYTTLVLFFLETYGAHAPDIHLNPIVCFNGNIQTARNIRLTYSPASPETLYQQLFQQVTQLIPSPSPQAFKTDKQHTYLPELFQKLLSIKQQTAPSSSLQTPIVTIFYRHSGKWERLPESARIYSALVLVIFVRIPTHKI